MHTPTVLVTAIGSFAADVAIEQFKAAGYRVIGCDIYPAEWLATSVSVDAFHQAPLARDEEDYISFIRSISADEGVNYIVPLTDIEVDVLNRNRAAIEEDGTKLCLSPTETLNICRDKWALHEFVVSHDCPVTPIPTVQLADAGTPETFPVVCKPANGRSSEGLAIIHDADEWEFFSSRNHDSNYIVQPFIPGRVVAVDVVRNPEQGMAVAIPRVELLRTPNGAGTSVFVFNDEKLQNQCVSLADALGTRGCVNFEFMKTEEGEYYFIECNPRFSGGIKFSCMTGYNCVLNHLRCFTGEKIDEPRPYVDVYIARKYHEYITKQGK